MALHSSVAWQSARFSLMHPVHERTIQTKTSQQRNNKKNTENTSKQREAIQNTTTTKDFASRVLEQKRELPNKSQLQQKSFFKKKSVCNREDIWKQKGANRMSKEIVFEKEGRGQHSHVGNHGTAFICLLTF
jgi:hypothetical protein